MPALDGIRGVAVLAVLLYHADLLGLHGGFLGVDVFFVLSGFLITSLLAQEAASTGRVDLGAFWARRARRLLPAVFAMVLLVACYAAWLAPDATRARVRGDAVATLAYVANWRFATTGVSYFEQYSDPSPLLHTWSLAVEEQFYLGWPLLVALALVVRAATGRRLRTARWLVLSVALLASAALTWAFTRPGADSARAFFGTDTRAQELLAGALLASWAHSRGWWAPAFDGPGRRRLALVGGLGLGGLVLAFVEVSDQPGWMHAGGSLVVSALAVCVVAAAAHPCGNLVQVLLSWPALRAVGVVSYGLYVWHWPIFVILDPQRTGLTGLALAALRLGTTACVAVASYRWVERPVRTGVLAGAGRVSSLLLVTVTALTCLVAVSVATAGAEPVEEAPAALGPGPAVQPQTDPSASATNDQTPRTLKVFLLGDSTAWNLHSEHPPAPSLHVQASGSTLLGCPLTGGRLVVDGRVQSLPTDVQARCDTWPSAWRQQEAQAAPDVAVLMLGNGQLFDTDLGGRHLVFATAGFESQLDRYLDVTLAGLRAGSPRVAVTTLPCFAKTSWGGPTTEDVTVVNDVGRQRWLNAAVRRYLDHHPGVELLDLRAYVCPGDRYVKALDGVRLRSDDGVHWSAAGSQLVWAWLAGQLSGPT